MGVVEFIVFAAVEIGAEAGVAAGAEAGIGAAAAGAVGAEAGIGASAASAVIDAGTAVVNAATGAVESVGQMVESVVPNISETLNISGDLSKAMGSGVQSITGIPASETSLATDALAKGIVGAGRGALTSGITGTDPGQGALGGFAGGAAGGLVSAGAKDALGAIGLGTDVLGRTASGAITGALGGAAGGAAGAAATGGDPGAGAWKGAATGAATGGGTALGGDVLGGVLGQGTSALLGSSAATAGVPTGIGSSYAPPAASTPGTAAPVSSSALSSLLSLGTDPGISSPVTGSSQYNQSGQPVWNQASLRTTDATGSQS